MDAVTGADPAGLMEALGHSFCRPELLVEALTHPSAAGPGTPSYERLEFLGDRVLGLVVVELLMRTFPGEDEGDLGLRYGELVNRDHCARAARELGLGQYLRMNAGEARTGGGKRVSVLADACEAVIGAVYVDGGLQAAAPLIERLWRGAIGSGSPPLNAKNALQEWAQGRRLPLPAYQTVAEEGPPHKRVFTVRVSVPGYDPAEAKGASKRVAEQGAAALLLERIEATHG